jgi:hypothetical protein
MISQHHQHRRNKMALPSNEDFANCELSFEELEAIAAGGFWGSLWHGIETVANDVYKVASGPVGGAIVFVAGLIMLGTNPVVQKMNIHQN